MRSERHEIHRRAAEFLAARAEKAKHLPPSAYLCIHWMAEFAIAERAAVAIELGHQARMLQHEANGGTL